MGVRVALYYGDADYICNWFGGEAVSKAVNYTHTAEVNSPSPELAESSMVVANGDFRQFNAAGYAPFVVDGTEYGEVRQYGNFSFLRMYESGHEVPFYQPVVRIPNLPLFTACPCSRS